jgi:hypothetical protein
MSKITLLVLALVATPSPGRACGMTEEDMRTMRENRALAVANKCENAIVRPGFSIGAIYVGESAEDAVHASAEGIAFEIEGGKVTRVRHTAPNASDLPQIAGLAIARDRDGVHVTVRAL